MDGDNDLLITDEIYITSYNLRMHNSTVHLKLIMKILLVLYTSKSEHYAYTHTSGGSLSVSMVHPERVSCLTSLRFVLLTLCSFSAFKSRNVC